ncbi:DUF2510 domain-containing protein [Streptomyces sp. NPDC005423]|uniref:DUF2510 domain-containing protein n=1 Tax=Streptomyces sp. NPDC005423 TaxID=3155343 RepID=UPI0033A088F2
MTQVTPPGWYPDPGQTNDGPAAERWWDGKAWTDQTRPTGSAGAWGPPTQPPAAGAYPAYPAGPPAAPRRGLRTAAAVAIAVVVLVSIGVGVYALAGHGSSGNSAGGQAGSQQGQNAPGGQGAPEGQNGTGGQGGPFGGSGGSGGTGGSGGGDGATPAPSESSGPKIKAGGTVSDSLDGISLPVPADWYGQVVDGVTQVTSNDSYKCPGDTSQSCTKGGAYSAPAALLGVTGTTAEEVAKADIAGNAKSSYGGKTYGSLTSHQVLASEAVTVAGQKGYLVRWKAVTSKGADGYVESLAFPAPGSAQQIVVVRFGVDVGQRQSVIDEITKGIAVSSGDGSGQKI